MAVKRWIGEAMHGGWVQATVTLDTTDTTTGLQLPNFPQKTVQILPDTGVTITDLDLLGANLDDAPDLATNDADYQNLRQAHDNTLTFTSLVAGTLADIFESPRFLKVTNFTATGGTQQVTVRIIGYTSR
jgi:hypothetical protein